MFYIQRRDLIREDYLDVNPLQGVKGFKPATARERALSENELKTVLRHAQAAPYPYGRMIEVLVLTGMRRREMAHLEWSFINEPESLITLPSQLVENGRSFTFPIGDRLQNVFSNLPDLPPKIDQYLFPSSRSTGTVFNGWGKVKERFDANLDGVSPYTLHDLRRTFATTHAKIGTPVHVTEKLLNHVSGTISGVAAVYNRHSYI